MSSDRKQRTDGVRTREAIVREAVSLATVDGLEGLSIGNLAHALDMTVFFLVVGLEIKRELSDGHLSSRKAALLPVTAAIGGMLVPALLYLAIAGGSAPRGWAIPIATDIALAVGVVALAGPRIPGSARAFLLGLAIVDDIGAIVVIAFVYSTGVAIGWLAAGMAALVVVALLKRFGVTWTWVYVVVGCLAWFGFYKGGVHPTIAGVAMKSHVRLSGSNADSRNDATWYLPSRSVK